MRYSVYFFVLLYQTESNLEWVIVTFFVQTYESLLEMWKPHDETWEIFIVNRTI